MENTNPFEKVIELWLRIAQNNKGAWQLPDDTIRLAFQHQTNQNVLVYIIETMLRNFIDQYTVNFGDIIYKRSERLQATIDDVRELNELIEKNDYEKIKEQLYGFIDDFLVTMEYKSDKMNFRSSGLMAKVIKNQYKFIGEMKTHQFVKGRFNTNQKPLFAKHILCYDSINTAITHVQSLPGNYIALIAIKEQEEYDAPYFAYIVRNGDNIYIHTDLNRANVYDWRFSHGHTDSSMPYVLCGDWKYNWFTTDENTGEIKALNTDKYYVAKKDKDWDDIMIRELEPYQVLYQMFMFDYLQTKYFKNQVTLPQLSYTMQTTEITKLGCNINPINSKALALVKQEQLQVEYPNPVNELDKTINDIGDQFNKYRDVIKSSDKQLVTLRTADQKLLTTNSKQQPVVIDADRGKLVTKQVVPGISNNFFGSREQIQEMVKANMQKNIAKKLYATMKVDFAENVHPKLMRFFNYQLETKRDDIIKRLIIASTCDNKLKSVPRIVKWKNARDRNLSLHRTWRTLYGDVDECALSGTKKTSYAMFFDICNSDDLMYLFDVKREELPFELQNIDSFSNRGFGKIGRKYPLLYGGGYAYEKDLPTNYNNTYIRNPNEIVEHKYKLLDGTLELFFSLRAFDSLLSALDISEEQFLTFNNELFTNPRTNEEYKYAKYKRRY